MAQELRSPVALATADVVSARSLSRSFESTVVLDRLDLDLAPGEFVALLGRRRLGQVDPCCARSRALDREITERPRRTR